jgi:hypothetical protein
MDIGALIGALTGLNTKKLAAGAAAGAAAGGVAGVTGREGFDQGAVDRARGLLASAQTEAATPDYSKYVNPPRTDGEGRVAAYQQLAQMQNPQPEPLSPLDKVARAEKDLTEAERAQRKHAIGADKKDHSGRTPISKRTDRMTPEEYEALDPTQKAAVDFNARLVTAVRKDRHNQDTYLPAPDEQAAYDASVQEMFGKGGGSKMFAPATVAVLGQLGFKDDAGDLDDFLRLKAAIKEKDLGRLDVDYQQDGTPVMGPVVQRNNQGDVLNPVQMDRVVLAQTLAAKENVLQKQITEGVKMLQTLNATAAVDRGAREEAIGGTAAKPATMAGYGPPTDASGAATMDGYFQKAIDYLADPKVDSNQIVANIKGATTPEQFRAFLAFAKTRADQTERYGVALSNVPEGRSVEEFRKLLSTIGGAP